MCQSNFHVSIKFSLDCVKSTRTAMISLVVSEWLRVRLIEWLHWIVSNPQELLVCRMTHSHSLTAIPSKIFFYRHTNSTLTVSKWLRIMSCSDSLSVLQYVAVICSVLQCVAVICSVLQCVAVICSVLQCVAVTRILAIMTWCFTSLLWAGYD